ncbi:MAG: cardiolipin synthase [Gammaproteobacteria bacterium]|nr:cardiolipin synthase [Gammaproteobacteria bacterium]MBU1490630.1 cardiolipin synthase [Gammaproteobacteria bacterium]MBU2067935.1 cardiolipin synthase [Gammaproteobacteria bacterium]MBU2139996.1 cardiolipin synthase [Gammaproteobacteria bacterium]MBU2217404.1 cardiolipin synthase [Gammaproteobacteria bacterium]
MFSGLPYEYLLGWLIALIHGLGIVAAVHAVLTVRTAQGAIAWALSLFFMPYLTLLPYLVFGRSRFDAYIAARRDIDRQMHSAVADLDWRPWVDATVQPGDAPAYDRLAALPRLGRLPCLGQNRVQLLIDGEATFAALFEALEQAREVILIQFFIVHDDALGRRLQALLLARAAAGVQVFFLYDGIGSHALPRAYLQGLRNGGVQVHAFPTRGGWFNRFQLNFRNHRKVVVVDGEVGFLGGLNVGDEYLGLKPPLAPWRDTHLAVHGPVVAALQESFAEDWYWAARTLPPLLLPSVYPEESMRCQLIASGPADAQETCSLLFVEAINSARERLWLTSPYFIPDEALFSALRLAVLRGVDVRLLLPSRPDHKVVYAASSLYALEALRAGVRVFRYRPGFLHQKVVLIDDEACLIGSANLDNRSLRLNFEVSLLTVDRVFAGEVAQMLERDFSHSRELVGADRKHAHRLQQLGMRVARLISPIL